MITLVTETNFEAEVLKAKQPVLVEFWTSWSGPCQTLEPVLADLADASAGKLKLVRINADESLDLSIWYSIEGIPTLMCFVKGRVCLKVVGTLSKKTLLAQLGQCGVSIGAARESSEC